MKIDFLLRVAILFSLIVSVLINPCAFLLIPLIGMAKVDGPLFSLEARGKIGDAIVYFPWKGRHAVRQWLKPTNPRDVDQKIIRQKLAGFGKCLAAMETPGAVLANGSAAVVAWKAKTPATLNWNAYFTGQGMEDLSIEANYIALSAALFGCDDTSDIWNLNAVALGLETLLSTADAFATDITPEMQLIAAAYAAYKVELSTATDIYSVYPSLWTTAQISQFATDFTAGY